METATYIWRDGELIPWGDAKVHFLSHGLQYGTGVFEGIRSYSTPDGPAVFRLVEHMDRLISSADAYGFPRTFTSEALVEGCLHLLRENELESAYIRPLTFFGEGTVGLYPKDSTIHTMMAAFHMGPYLGPNADKGIRAMVSSWRRISHNSFIPTAKGSGGYLNSMLAKQEALRAGYDEAIMLNSQGAVAEGSGMNLFVVSDGVVHTPPISAGILDGITRGTVMELLTSEGVEVRETEIARGALYSVDEIFLTGTAAEVTPVIAVDGRTVGSGTPGPVTSRVVDLYRDAVVGKLDGFRHWLSFV